MRKHPPKYRHHKGSGQALVELNGKRIYLGKHGSEASREAYQRFLQKWVSGRGDIRVGEPRATPGKLVEMRRTNVGAALEP